MTSKIEIKKHTFFYPDKKKNIRIKLIGDLQYSASFNDGKLEILSTELARTKPDYLFIAGDLLDSTNFLRCNKGKRLRLVRWIEELGKNQPTFISLGNHDFTFLKDKSWVADWSHDFWKEISSFDGIHISHYEPYYEDENIVVYMLELNYEYYYNNNGEESREILLEQLRQARSLLTGLDSKKVKIMMNHSPIWMSDKDVLEQIRDYDFVFSGHMHNGMIPPFLDKIIKNNRGLIAPNKSLFPDNSRGVKSMSIDEKKIYLIINGGITKLAECAGPLNKFNDAVYPMSIDEISISSSKLLK